MPRNEAMIPFGQRPDRPPEPVLFSAAVGGWLVSGYEECLSVIRRKREFSVLRSHYPGAEEIRGRRGVQLLDGPEHRALHAFLQREFSLKRVTAAEDRLVAACRERWDGFRRELDGGPKDLATGFCDPVAIEALCAFMGFDQVPKSLVRAYEIWNRTLTDWVRTEGTEDRATDEARSAAAEFASRLRPLLGEQVEKGSRSFAFRLNDFGRSTFEDWSREDLVDQYRLLFLAGGEGIAQLLTTASWVLLSHSESLARIEGMVEECLRLAPPAQLRPYVANRRTTIGGMEIEAGKRVYLVVRLANTDPSLRRCPLEFDPDRPVSGHLSFNLGERFCVGAHLSRAVARVAATAVGRSWEDLHLCEDGPEPTMSGYRFKGVRPLVVRRGSHASS